VSNDLIVSAPGKVMVSGEYVVLTGSTALVAATDARVRVHLSPRAPDGSPPPVGGSQDPRTLPPEALLAHRLAEEVLGLLPPMNLSVDTRALREGDRKLGLGSSAAAAAGVVAAVAAAHGLDVTSPQVRTRLLPIALEGHRAVAPDGSGADVAASMLGGLVRVRREGGSVEATSVAWPSSLHFALLWTGSPARTSDLVARVRSAAARDAAGHERALGPLREAAARLLDAIERDDRVAAIDAVGAHHEAMSDLGRWADAPIVTPSLARAAELAREVGGASKPSGAGGGDVALAVLPDASARSALEQACLAAGLTLLPLRLGDGGPCVELPA